jgi:hypothetical protein
MPALIQTLVSAVIRMLHLPGDGQLVQTEEQPPVLVGQLLHRHCDPQGGDARKQGGEHDLQLQPGEVLPRHWCTP